MNDVTVKIDTRAFEKELSDFLDSNSETIAREIAADAKRSGPFKDKTGRLRKSIRAVRSKYEWGEWLVKMGGKGAMQAYIIEYGRDPGDGYPKAPAFPTLNPAKDRAIESAKRLFGVK